MTPTYKGMELFDGNMKFVRTLARAGAHHDVGSDTQGHEIMVWADGSRNKAYIVKTNLADGTNVDLWSFPWSLAVHISLPDHAAFCIVTAYDPKDQNNPGNEILKVWLDSVNGSHVESLGKHGSNADIYVRQPKASVSPDGTKIVWDSNGSVYARAI